ncbi:hypothetical protein H310_01523 [Aphanomyces invadans]|uniref:PA domain-containing protein n=1 Tax=Aphanomyces invadans TaxID=157072 RepID=A0A024UTT5_9STRA|nr:hypothetical protein H310_01523 [Aphanomyces invadans]ETW09063.1 hypothetical protein H310_01523 [Aphanomyces invadans]|eukprot:XP_008862868.1 hypothetical protein H310_01523 [Aphanomyces invadans]
MGRWQRLVGPFLLAMVTISASNDDANGHAQQCGGGVALEYVVVVHTTDPLGVILSDKLQVLSFVQDENGRDRAVEASGLVEVGDALVGVNDVLTEGAGLHTVVNWIRDADVPKKLTFRAHNTSRCVPLESASMNHDVESINFVVAAQGNQRSTELYALVSEFGDAIACELYPIVLADPTHACLPLNNNVTGRFVLVQSSRQCSPHQQALVVGRSGGFGVILVQHEGKKIESVLSPRGWIGTIRTPIVMVSQEAGRYVADLTTSATAAAPATIQVVVSDTCAKRYRDPTLVAITMSEKHAMLIEATSGDLTIVSQDGTSHSAEFVKARTSGALDLLQHPLVIVPGNLCLFTSLVWVRGLYVLSQVSPSCPIEAQLAKLVDAGATGVLWAVENANAPDSVVSIVEIPTSSTTMPFPCAFVSRHTLHLISLCAEDGPVSIAFAPNNAYASQYEELQVVADPANWPSSSRGRRVLYHRMRKAMDNSDGKLQALDLCFQAAEAHHPPPVEIKTKASE